MLFVEATGMTADELNEWRARQDIVDRVGYVTTVRARKVDNMIVSSIERIKEGYWHALQSKRKEAASLPATA
jgi:hypothetical protein